MTREQAERKLQELVRSSVHLAILRHDLGDDDMDIDQVLSDTVNAVQGIDTCAEEPIPEWTAALSLLCERLERQDEVQGLVQIIRDLGYEHGCEPGIEDEEDLMLCSVCKKAWEALSHFQPKEGKNV